MRPRLPALPEHVGVVMDGNRRWARAARHRDVSVGHRYGAQHLEDFLGWCVARDIRHVSVYVLSADNIRRRGKGEVDYLFELLRTTIPDLVARSREDWTLHVSGDRELLPVAVRLALGTAESETRDDHVISPSRSGTTVSATWSRGFATRSGSSRTVPSTPTRSLTD